MQVDSGWSVSHRLSTVKHADRIIVMENGRNIEEGTHDGLVAAGGHYADLYNTYFRHQSPDYRVTVDDDDVRLDLGVIPNSRHSEDT